MEIIDRVREMQETSRRWKVEGKTIAFVPTMGFLHEGHLKLVEEGRRRAKIVVMSIFVNPTQFGPGEDFEKYPRDLGKDKKLAESCGVNILFVPAAEEIYPPGDQSKVVVTELTRGLCGPFRPGHFLGVTTVVGKLFNIVQPDAAIFGEKDYQQLIVIKRMVTDLKWPIEIVGVPTVRESDGLAMSSRNSYLEKRERDEALNLSRALERAQKMVKKGEKDTEKILNEVKSILLAGKQTTLDYAEAVDPETLQPLTKIKDRARLIMAARINGKRLIDNGELIP